jgi:hypothetical protein
MARSESRLGASRQSASTQLRRKIAQTSAIKTRRCPASENTVLEAIGGVGEELGSNILRRTPTSAVVGGRTGRMHISQRAMAGDRRKAMPEGIAIPMGEAAISEDRGAGLRTTRPTPVAMPKSVIGKDNSTALEGVGARRTSQSERRGSRRRSPLPPSINLSWVFPISRAYTNLRRWRRFQNRLGSRQGKSPTSA